MSTKIRKPLNKVDLAKRRNERERLNNLPIRFELRWFKKGQKAGRDSQILYVIEAANHADYGARKRRVQEKAEAALREAMAAKHTMKTWRATGNTQGHNDDLYYDTWAIVPIREPLENDLGQVHP